MNANKVKQVTVWLALEAESWWGGGVLAVTDSRMARLWW